LAWVIASLIATMHSLRTKAALFIGTLFCVAFAMVALVSTQITRIEEDITTAQPAPVVGLGELQSFYSAHHTWDGVRSLLLRLSRQNERDLILLDYRYDLVTSSDSAVHRVTVEHPTAGSIRIEVRSNQNDLRIVQLRAPNLARLVVSGKDVGTVLALPNANRRAPTQTLTAVSRKLLFAIGVIGAISILAGLALAQYLLDPIRQVSAGADRLRRGFFDRIVVSRNDEVGALAEAFNALSTELEQAQRQRREIIADIAHELRSPLTNMRCAIEEMRDGMVAATPPQLQSLLDEALQLQHLVADLHDLAMADAHVLHLNLDTIDLREEVAAALAAFFTQFERKHIRIIQTVDSMPGSVEADPARVKQILSNLLSNALRATPDGGTVRVSASKEAGVVAVSVEDSGTGFNPANAELLFERFYREEASRSRETGGSGLGLALARQLVLAHGGQISAQNTGHGARFTFTLPLRARGEQNQAAF